MLRQDKQISISCHVNERKEDRMSYISAWAKVYGCLVVLQLQLGQ